MAAPNWVVLPADTLVADRVGVAAAVVDGHPSLVFSFAFGGREHPPIVLSSRGELTSLVPLVSAAVQNALANDGLTEPGRAVEGGD